MIESIRIPYGSQTLAGTLFLPDPVRGPVPATVSAAGLGGVKEMSLPALADALAASGIATLLFDYAGFGASEGEPRQHASPVAQLAQFSAAFDALCADARIDRERLGVWGPSMAGGHTLRLAATEPRVRCAVAITPFITAETRHPDPKLIETVIADAEARGRGEAGRTIATIGRPGELAVLTADGAWEWCQRISARLPSFRNELTVASLIDIAGYRPLERAADIAVPVRVILAKDDTIAPPADVRRALATIAGLDIVELPGGHFELLEQNVAAVAKSMSEWFRVRMC